MTNNNLFYTFPHSETANQPTLLRPPTSGYLVIRDAIRVFKLLYCSLTLFNTDHITPAQSPSRLITLSAPTSRTGVLLAPTHFRIRKGHLLRSRRTPWRAKPRDAPALRRREDGEEGREGGNQTSDVARGGGGTRCPRAESPTGKCRRAGKPRRGSIAEKLERRPSGRSHEDVVRGYGDMSLKGRESARRAFGRLRPVERLVERTPKGRTQTPDGSSGNPYLLWFFESESSKCRETP